MKKLIMTFVAVLFLSACSTTPPARHSEGSALLYPVAAGNPGTASVARGIIKEFRQLTGITRVESVPLAFESESLFHFEKFHAFPGNPVKEGQILATLYTSNLREHIAELEEQFSLLNRVHSLTMEMREASIELTRIQHAEALNNAAVAIDDTDFATAAVFYAESERLRLERDQFAELHAYDILDLTNRLNELREMLKGATIVAPFDGTVTFVTDRAPGSWVSPFEYVIFISANEQSPFVEFMSGVLGARHSAVRITGNITGREVELQYSAQTREEAAYNIMHGLPERIRFDVLCDFEFSVGELVWMRMYSVYMEDVLRVPVSALFWQCSEPYVYVRADDTWIPFQPEFGVITETFAEVLSGLAEGDELLVN